MSELLSGGTVRREVCRRIGGGAPRAWHDTGWASFYAKSTQLEYMPRQRTDKVDARFEGHKGDQVHVENVRVRIRNELRVSRSSVGADGGAVARMVELASCFSVCPTTPPSPRMW